MAHGKAGRQPQADMAWLWAAVESTRRLHRMDARTACRHLASEARAAQSQVFWATFIHAGNESRRGIGRVGPASQHRLQAEIRQAAEAIRQVYIKASGRRAEAARLPPEDRSEAAGRLRAFVDKCDWALDLKMRSARTGRSVADLAAEDTAETESRLAARRGYF